MPQLRIYIRLQGCESMKRIYKCLACGRNLYMTEIGLFKCLSCDKTAI